MSDIPFEFWDEIATEIFETMSPIVRDVALAGALELGIELLGKKLPIALDWNLVNQRAIDFVQTYTYDLVRYINDTSRNTIQNSITRYFDEGWERGQLLDSLSQFGPIRAEVIATTEVTRATAAGDYALGDWLKDEGVEMVSVWQTSNDEKVCDVCGPRNDVKEGEEYSDYEGVTQVWTREGEDGEIQRIQQVSFLQAEAGQTRKPDPAEPLRDTFRFTDIPQIDFDFVTVPYDPPEEIFITDTTVRGNTGHGIFLSGAGEATLDRVRVESHTGGKGITVSSPSSVFKASGRDSMLAGNTVGLSVQSGGQAIVISTLATGNTGAGFAAVGTSLTGTANLTLVDSQASDNAGGVSAANFGSTATVTISGVTVTRNVTGISVGAGTEIRTRRSNTVDGIGTNTSISGTIRLS